MKPTKTKRRNWSDEETKYFIELCGEYEILSIKDGRLQTNLRKFKLIEERMTDAGYDQTAKQLQVKFKHLKEFYYRNTNEIQYRGATATRFNYYEEMNALVAAAGSELIKNDQNMAFDVVDDESREEVKHRHLLDIPLYDDHMPFQFDADVKKESDSISNASDVPVGNHERPKRSTAKRKNYASSSTDEQSVSQPAMRRRNDLNADSLTSVPNDVLTHWYKNQSILQAQFFEEQMKLQQVQQRWMERMLQNERKNLNEQITVMMKTFLEGVQRLAPFPQSTSSTLSTLSTISNKSIDKPKEHIQETDNTNVLIQKVLKNNLNTADVSLQGTNSVHNTEKTLLSSIQSIQS